ncbi:MAG: FprA family A-type flavoprotein [Muribaculum sp.]|nr:FprA family A-type flavoprotein [Muribaculum sp.]
MLNIGEFCKDIVYAGVDDHTSKKFEGLWALPDGVSYNSYLIKDDKNVLVDTVELEFAPELLTTLREQLQGKSLDYLVINHMEPDHSGSIPAIMEAYPEVKLVGNKQTVGMIKGFYGIDCPERTIEVADGQTICLGRKSLCFYLTPMVHWPETMMTYCPEAGLLFSGDAFGTFGALNGNILDAQCDKDLYFREMYRYYACIVAKYNKFVQRALQKLGALRLEYIAPTHGPVWHTHLREAVDLVERLSRAQYEDGVTIIYGSMYGNTAAVAARIAETLAALGMTNVKVHDASYTDMSFLIADAYRYKNLIVGAPTYSMSLFPPVKMLMDAMVTREVRGKNFASFGSFTWSPVTKKYLEEYASQLGWNIKGAVEFKQGPNQNTLDAAEALADSFVD